MIKTKIDYYVSVGSVEISVTDSLLTLDAII